tara:strand:+ start:17 stop:667 length:651 start_codon:yes stop_codon:yes gene_type:complete
MAAVTGAAIAVAGLGMSAAQAIKSSKDMRIASNAAQAAKNELSKISETNAFKQVQVPTLGLNLAQQSQAQRSASALSAVQSAGAEGVIGGVGQIMQAGNEQDLQLAAQADEAKFKRDAMQADAEMGISSRKQERDYMIGQNEVISENMKRAQAESNRNTAIEGMLTSASQAVKAGSNIKGKSTGVYNDQADYNGDSYVDASDYAFFDQGQKKWWNK